MKQHYAPPWRGSDLLRAVACIALCAAIAVMAGIGLVPID